MTIDQAGEYALTDEEVLVAASGSQHRLESVPAYGAPFLRRDDASSRVVRHASGAPVPVRAAQRPNGAGKGLRRPWFPACAGMTKDSRNGSFAGARRTTASPTRRKDCPMADAQWNRAEFMMRIDRPTPLRGAAIATHGYARHCRLRKPACRLKGSPGFLTRG